MKVLVIDNYDSFTYNLVELLRILQVVDFQVVNNDQIDWSVVDSCDKLLISPGPGTPDQAGRLIELIRNYHQSKSLLGICLGHQAVAQVFGGQLINLPAPRHGQTTAVELMAKDPLFSGLPEKITVGLYHSWAVDWASLPPELQVIASEGDRIMGIRHRNFDITGLQFHPESYATPFGKEILKNWLLL
ncbi:MAG: aminodeoxychorismate/anthranilate synthase component II [Cyclobacteriaceae bacterium]|nr:MAG: aminodeoxychorismate/anthranilate synthase component II [Cyclobacteriaceae bacterium]